GNVGTSGLLDAKTLKGLRIEGTLAGQVLAESIHRTDDGGRNFIHQIAGKLTVSGQNSGEGIDIDTVDAGAVVTGPEWTDITMTDLNGTFEVTGPNTGSHIAIGALKGTLQALHLKDLMVNKLTGNLKGIGDEMKNLDLEGAEIQSLAGKIDAKSVD